MRTYKRGTLGERMECRIVPEPNSGCFLFWGAVQSNGYGMINRGDGGAALAHRVAWELRHGAIPPGMHVCHRCDVRLCVNPDHMFLGTQAENLADMRRKGRGSMPPRRGKAAHA